MIYADQNFDITYDFTILKDINNLCFWFPESDSGVLRVSPKVYLEYNCHKYKIKYVCQSHFQNTPSKSFGKSRNKKILSLVGGGFVVGWAVDWEDKEVHQWRLQLQQRQTLQNLRNKKMFFNKKTGH